MVNIKNLGTPVPYHNSALDLGVPEKETYGHKMRRLRLELALTQPQVAEIAGCAQVTISAWERGKFQGNTPEAAELPRRVILLLGARLRNRQRRKGVESIGRARRKTKAADQPRRQERA